MAGVLSAKDRVEKEVLNLILSEMESGKLTLPQAQDVAKVTLEKIGEIEAHQEAVLTFYESLARKYPAFQLLYTQAKGDLVKSKELTAYKQALEAIHAGNVAGANQIVESAVAQTANETTNTR